MGLATDKELKTTDREAKEAVDVAVEEAKRSPNPEPVDLWEDVYAKGNEPPCVRGRERMEVSFL